MTQAGLQAWQCLVTRLLENWQLPARPNSIALHAASVRKIRYLYAMLANAIYT
jgi:hypothetical protein